VLPDYTALAMAGALPAVSTDSSSNHKYGKNIDSASNSFIDKIKFDSEKAAKELEEVMGKREATPAITDSIRQGAAMQGYNPDMGLSAVVPQYNPEQEGNPELYPTWMRYAPVVGAGIMSLTDLLGITNKPDYSGAASIEAAANRAGYAPKINYNPIGNYLTYRPMDIWFEQNRMDANARATDRAIMNNATPIGTKMAGLLASGYNNQIADGQLYRNALEYNDAKRERVADFNRRTNMFNSQMGLEAAMANARYHQAAQQMGLSGLAQAAALRDSIDARTGAARSANLSNFLTSLGNIGRENFAMNQINTDRSRNYYGRLNGDVSGYKRKKACGGKMNRK
jgi:hypothetical protein